MIPIASRDLNDIAVYRLDSSKIDELIPEIVRVFRDDDVVPWHAHDTCLAWVMQRAKRGFYIALAYCGGKLAGYSEWIETHDQDKKILYLGMMQVDCDMRSRGIGGAMLRDGEQHAKNIGALYLRTIPEDERAHDFYRKHGFCETDCIYVCTCATMSDAGTDKQGVLAVVSRQVADTQEFIFGLCQSSSRWMYEVANYDPEMAQFRVISAYMPGGYLQFRYRQGAKTALALYWTCEQTTTDTVAAILRSGHLAGFEEIQFYFRTKYVGLFAGQSTDKEGVEIERKL